MPNPWLSIPLSDYEGHMNAPGVEQLRALSFLFGRALGRARPRSVAVLGIAGGNGLEHIDPVSVTRVVGIDVHAAYLDEVRRRYPALPLELHCVDLSAERVQVAPVDLVHAALVFEHTGLGLALDNALALVAPGGALSVVLQLPAADTADVAPTGFASIQSLRDHFTLVGFDELRDLVEAKGLDPVVDEAMAIPGGKSLWLGVFARP
jgi:threonine dehydrogenase-like Zn-dependent dehydrogenase